MRVFLDWKLNLWYWWSIIEHSSSREALDCGWELDIKRNDFTFNNWTILHIYREHNYEENKERMESCVTVNRDTRNETNHYWQLQLLSKLWLMYYSNKCWHKTWTLQLVPNFITSFIVTPESYFIKLTPRQLLSGWQIWWRPIFIQCEMLL